jgi:hypothetical protein
LKGHIERELNLNDDLAPGLGVGDDPGGQYLAMRTDSTTQFTDRGSRHHDLLGYPNFAPTLRMSIVAMWGSDASNRLLGSRQTATQQWS